MTATSPRPPEKATPQATPPPQTAHLPAELRTSPVPTASTTAPAYPHSAGLSVLRRRSLSLLLHRRSAAVAAGLLVQTVTRNPLASPDVIGIGHGAAAATVLALATGTVASPGALPAVSVAGGLAAAALVYVLAWRHGMQPSRFVLTGVGIGVALSAVVQLCLTESELAAAEQVKLWLTGSLNGRGWEQAQPLGWMLLLSLPALVRANRALRPLGPDADTAAALGVRVHRTQPALTVLGVILAATATEAAGPIGFIALTAPQLSRRLTHTPQLPLAASALTGAVVLVTADLVARTLMPPLEIPVGALTALVGGPYLPWLLAVPGGQGCSPVP